MLDMVDQAGLAHEGFGSGSVWRSWRRIDDPSPAVDVGTVTSPCRAEPGLDDLYCSRMVLATQARQTDTSEGWRLL